MSQIHTVFDAKFIDSCMLLFGRQDRELAPAQAPATPATAIILHQKWKLEARPQSRWESCVTGSDLRSFFLWKICGKMSFLFENNFLNTGMCRAAAGAWASANPRRVTLRLSWNWYEAKGWARWAPGDGIGLLVCMHLVKSLRPVAGHSDTYKHNYSPQGRRCCLLFLRECQITLGLIKRRKARSRYTTEGEMYWHVFGVERLI